MINSKSLQEQIRTEAKRELARRHLRDFTDLTFSKFFWSDFHEIYYQILDLFVRGRIKKLMITVPPQHGKSEGSTRRLPAFMLGKNPDLKIAIASYSTPFARKFNRDVQKIIDDSKYHEIFPNTLLNSSNVVTISDSSLRNSDEFEIVNHKGGLKAVGRGGPLTGNPVDIMIMDDLYKDYMEANSPVIRENVWDWYTTTVKTRLHNDSQELIVFTRWHEDDLIGRLEKNKDEKVHQLKDLKELEGLGPDTWIKVNFEAIKSKKEKTAIDKREKNEPLYPEKHNLKKLISTRNLDPEKFDCLYQGNPKNKKGLLYKAFGTYESLPEFKIIKNYTDSADTGTDYTCSVVYGVGLKDNKYYVIDIVYTDESMDETEPLIISLLERNQVNEADFESNNGGRYFAKKIDDQTRCKISWFHQGKNKEARIISNSATVNSDIIFPKGWHIRFPELFDHLTGFKKMFKSNKQDGGPDVLTGIIEKNNYSSKPQIIW